MTTASFPLQARDLRITTLHAAATIIAILLGGYALVALVSGSPLEFGLALAGCGACWIAAHFLEWTVEREQVSRSRAVVRGRFNPDHHGSDHPIFVGGDEYRPRLHADR